MDASLNVGQDTVKCGIPEITSLGDISKSLVLQEQVIEFSKNNPSTEHIYKFELPEDGLDLTNMSNHAGWWKNCLRSRENHESMNCVVAGSYALWTLSQFLNKHNWKPGDIDLFLLNRTQHARHNPGDGLLDIVHTMDKTAEEVIINFDLPCCRVAFDTNYTFYVSIHALTAILSKNVYLPSYLKDGTKFKYLLQKYELSPSNQKGGTVDFYHTFLINRMQDRIKKYQSRGFSIQWYDTEYILPWIKQRFAYVNFDLMKSTLPSTEKLDWRSLTDEVRDAKYHDNEKRYQIRREALQKLETYVEKTHRYGKRSHAFKEIKILQVLCDIELNSPGEYHMDIITHVAELQKNLFYDT